MPQQVVKEVGVDNGYDTNFFGSIERASQRFDDLDEESKVFLNSMRGNGCDDDGDHRDIDIVEDDHDDIKSPKDQTHRTVETDTNISSSIDVSMRSKSISNKQNEKEGDAIVDLEAAKGGANVDKGSSSWRSNKTVWMYLDIFSPMVVASFTFFPSLYLMIVTGSYFEPGYSLWVVSSIATGEGIGVVFEIVRYFLKQTPPHKTRMRYDRITNYFFSSLIALVIGVWLQNPSIYWTRRWLTTLLPFTGGIFQYCRRNKYSKMTINFIGTFMLCIILYRILLIGEVIEFTRMLHRTAWYLVLMFIPLLYVEMIWVSALCPLWLKFQQGIKAKIIGVLSRDTSS